VGDFSSVLLQYGIAGVAIIAEAFVIMRLYGDNQRLQKEKDDLQEARRMDAKETVDKVTMPLGSISQTIGLLYDKIKSSKEV
jgi:hypothetical protein